MKNFSLILLISLSFVFGNFAHAKSRPSSHGKTKISKKIKSGNKRRARVKRKYKKVRKSRKHKKRRYAKTRKRKRRKKRAPAFLGTFSSSGDGKKPIQVRGQTRMLNMSLILKSKKEKIRFVEIRQNYRKEILETRY